MDEDMNKYELLPTEDNLIKTLQEDLLNRNKDVAGFYDLLSNDSWGNSVAIDSRWGSGKTFFVKQTMLLINANNPFSQMDKEKRDKILNCFFLQKNSNRCDFAVYYDAWENDNDVDPALSLVYTIAKQIDAEYKPKDNSKLSTLLAAIFSAFSRRDINALVDKLKEQNPIDVITKEKDLKDSIDEFFAEILLERGNRLIIFVDELDRCRPSYAVQLLERIKHYFSNDRVTFVFSVNIEELQHTIKRYYGNDFNACQYLDRFFDLRMSLPPADLRRFYEKMGVASYYTLNEVCKRIINIYHMEMRQIMHFYSQIKAAVYDSLYVNVRDFTFTDGRGREVLLTYIVPLLIGLKIVDIKVYYEFADGRNSKPLIEMYKNSKVGEALLNKLIDINTETYYDKDKEQRKVTAEEKLQELYDAVFVYEYGHSKGEHCKQIGELEFNAESKSLVKKAASMLSDYANFEVR